MPIHLLLIDIFQQDIQKSWVKFEKAIHSKPRCGCNLVRVMNHETTAVPGMYNHFWCGEGDE